MDIGFLINLSLWSFFSSLVSGAVLTEVFNIVYLRMVEDYKNNNPAPHYPEEVKRTLAKEHPFVSWAYHLTFFQALGGLFVIILSCILPHGLPPTW
ncbi:hypothetical protein A2572_02885 [Candidatus Collierbacteria bacterium RIFOXYD1_FULL_40_9]|uniref:Uncharacterized protein n=1 Tax=Candidatus Collierbacteria bacterium RIFOXYD1_FULL_40_9 TaxID=1817731 RepID=A0A1F5FV06_9BACT|nr:MAG: hypothetical protein A2572_02885 [Candidatus Collierbacteria bacterium RIFOXYD1_FULL_40_9]